MSRYVIKFSKEGTIRYISHLDLLRLFKRSFKRAGVRLQHTQGFSPHPKMSLAQPLSLGYSSSGEYLEFDTAEPYPAGEILEKLNFVLPEGVAGLSCNELPADGKSLAALTEYAGYEIKIPFIGLTADENGSKGNIRHAVKDDIDGTADDTVKDAVEKYMARGQIIIRKHQKKSGKDLKVDIRPLIREFSGMVDDNYITLTMWLAAGSTANLSPEAVLTTFCEFAGIRYDRAEVRIKRTEIYFSD